MTATHMAAIAARYNALKAMGALVEVDEPTFMELVGKKDHPMVVVGQVGVFSKKFVYFVAVDGFVFYCKTATSLVLSSCELVRAEKVRLPEL
jgi:hypothetical protein